MTRYNVNVVLIMDDERLLGHISRQVVEKAAYHGLKELPASEYMNMEYSSVSPSATLEEIQAQLVGGKQRILPVMEKNKVVGVITRTDLLNVLMEDAPLPQHPFDHKKGVGFVRSKNVASLMRGAPFPAIYRPFKVLWGSCR